MTINNYFNQLTTHYSPFQKHSETLLKYVSCKKLFQVVELDPDCESKKINVRTFCHINEMLKKIHSTDKVFVKKNSKIHGFYIINSENCLKIFIHHLDHKKNLHERLLYKSSQKNISSVLCITEGQIWPLIRAVSNKKLGSYEWVNYESALLNFLSNMKIPHLLPPFLATLDGIRKNHQKKITLYQTRYISLTVDKVRRFSLTKKIQFFTEMARCLSALHAKGFVHGDFKINNVVMTSAKSFYLIDFASCQKIDKKDLGLGTAKHTAPERAKFDVKSQTFVTTQAKVHPAYDSFSLGITILLTLLGEKIWPFLNDYYTKESLKNLKSKVHQIFIQDQPDVVIQKILNTALKLIKFNYLERLTCDDFITKLNKIKI